MTRNDLIQHDRITKRKRFPERINLKRQLFLTVVGLIVIYFLWNIAFTFGYATGYNEDKTPVICSHTGIGK